jgi:formate hydrogenlyase subunit 4
MARALGPAVPVGGMFAGVAALGLWVSTVSLRWLDTAVSLLLVAGLALSVAAYVRGVDARTRRLAIAAIGWNLFGFVVLAMVYVAG